MRTIGGREDDMPVKAEKPKKGKAKPAEEAPAEVAAEEAPAEVE